MLQMGEQRFARWRFGGGRAPGIAKKRVGRLYAEWKAASLGLGVSTTADKLDTLQAVELAEGVVIRLRVAGPILRAGAYALDMLIRAAVLVVASLCLGWLGIAIGERLVSGVLMLAWFLMEWFYPVIFEAGKRGATPGKRILGLRVVQASGSPISLGQAELMNFLRWIDGMPIFTYGFGMVSCLATRRFQRLGDLAAGTVVIYENAAGMQPNTGVFFAAGKRGMPGVFSRHGPISARAPRRSTSLFVAGGKQPRRATSPEALRVTTDSPGSV